MGFPLKGGPRPCRLCGHQHVRHPQLCLSGPLGRAFDPLGRQPDAAGRTGIPRNCRTGAGPDACDRDAAFAGERCARPSSGGRSRRCAGARSLNGRQTDHAQCDITRRTLLRRSPTPCSTWTFSGSRGLYQDSLILTHEDGFWRLSARSVRSGDVVHHYEGATLSEGRQKPPPVANSRPLDCVAASPR